MNSVQVLVVGAGPTGLALASQLMAFGAQVRLIDRAWDRAHESRALAIQPRTLEVLRNLGVTDKLVAAGNPAMRMSLHTHGRERSVPLFDLGMQDTAYPYLLFLSQAETERLLGQHLNDVGVHIERGVELVGLERGVDGAVASLRHGDGREEHVTARYVVGCDGAHSTVRHLAGIGFEGGTYPQTFVLADLEADSLDGGAAHAFLAERGMLFFFPLGHPASWRMLLMRPPADPTPSDAPVTLNEMQTLADSYTGGRIRLHDPVWMTNFRLHHRAAARYRAGPVFLAGDAAHIHSPAGGQGMNTGVQDAVNLGWKIAHALRGDSDPALLDTYELERAPVGRMVLRFTDRAFTIATSTNPLVRLARTRVAPALIPVVMAPRFVRSIAFRTISELSITYRHSPLSTQGHGAPRRGPRPGDRLPDTPLSSDGPTLHQLTAASGWHLVLCGPPHAWPSSATAQLDRYALTVHGLGAPDPTAAGQSAAAPAIRRLGVTNGSAALYLVRPDGHIGYRSGGDDLSGLLAYLDRWVGRPPEAS
ncbi:FAD-dependent monooxygenase [Micromonospora costi]|uniref:Monooxygenase n=1 Tax=Micromonospora costi TaxID=1530042 RepID=A0A3B0A460_9ACTN|nr:FAD-dependent monooxygenase [Micromonospora costi]RKN55214.1 monooxygenase [Micromonospora costi]